MTDEIRILRLKSRLLILQNRPASKDNGKVINKIIRQLRNYGVEI